MASFLNKAFDALEPLQREALGALDKSLGEEGLENADDYAEHAKSAEETGEKWAQVGLDKLKPEWDEQARKIGDNQEFSNKQKRKILDNLQKIIDHPQDSESKKLVQAIQNDLESISRRQKYAENAFLQTFQLFANLPDPSPYIHYFVLSVKKVSELDAENRRLRDSYEQKSTDSAQVSSLQQSVKQLEEEKAKAEKGVEKLVEAKLAESRKKFERELEDKRIKEGDLVKKLKEIEERFLQEKKQHAKVENELFELREKREVESNSVSQEVEMISRDLDQANQTIRKLEQANADLANEVKRVSTENEDSGLISSNEAMSERMEELRQALDLKEEENHHLQETIKRLNTAAERRSENDNENYRIQTEMETLQNEMDSLKSELESRPTLDEMLNAQKEIQVLKALVDTDFADVESESHAGDLEAALQAKNRRLTTELSILKESLKTQNEKIEKFQEELESKNSTIESQKKLIASLESDLSTGINVGTSKHDESESKNFALSGIREIVTKGHPVGDSPTGGSEQTILSIVCAQRDRLRKSVEELENSNTSLTSEIANNRSELNKMQSDNLALYEKIKYLQSYQADSRSREVVVSVPEVQSRGNVEGRYRKQYEEQLNPFTEFHRQEQEQRLKSLKVYDRIALSSGKFILTHRFMRIFIFFYTIILHIFIFALMYHETNEHFSAYLPSHSIDNLEKSIGADITRATLNGRG